MTGSLDGRADVHALGAVAYHLLTGHPARTGDLMSLLQAKLPPAPSTFRPGLRPVDAVILRALDPHPEGRWPDPNAFAKALRDAVGGSAAPAGRSVTGLGLHWGVWLLALAALIAGFLVGFKLLG